MVELDKLAGPEGGTEGRKLASHWLDQLAQIKDSTANRQWVDRGDQIEKRYRDERNRSGDDKGVRRYNALWSNIQILLPALFGKVPVPICERRFRDKDPVGRGAAQILERALRNEIEICGFGEALHQAVSDYLLPGRGTIWVRYEPKIAPGISLPPEQTTDNNQPLGQKKTGNDDDEEDENIDSKDRSSDDGDGSGGDGEGEQHVEDSSEEEAQEKLQETGDRVVRESTPVDYVPWKDFLIFPSQARVWAEVTAVGKRVYMSRSQMKKRFGDEIGKAIPLQRDDRGLKVQGVSVAPTDQDKGQVIEIWSIDHTAVFWVAEGYDYLCDRKDDPLNLENFWPCPRPLFANPTNGTLVPVADYIQYQDQALQIDELTLRISLLAKACKVAGVYNAAAKDIKRMFNESIENELIPVDDWAAFAQDGQGVAGNISLLPLKEIMGVLNELITVRKLAIEDMDRLTGINDIMRGTSDARETLGGVRLKQNSTGTRITARQNEVARFARDTVRIMADIMCQHFSPQSLIEASGALYQEGLGPEDMPDLTDLQKPPPGPPQQPPGMPPKPPGLMAPPPPMPPGPPPGPLQ